MIAHMLVDGKKIAEVWQEKLKNNVLAMNHKPSLAIVIVGNNPVVENFVRMKRKFGESIGANIFEFRFASSITSDELRSEVVTLSTRDDIDGIIIQLPLPDTFNVEAILNAVPTTKDVDMLAQDSIVHFARGTAKIFPPVASAVQEIFEHHDINVEGKEVLVLGYGRLVGKPVSILLRHNNAHVTVIDKPILDLGTHTKESAIIICRVGIPKLITADMISAGTILIDAGTSEAGGRIVGDVDDSCRGVASLMTPVPGGVGPIAVAMLFKNLIILAHRHHENAQEPIE